MERFNTVSTNKLLFMLIYGLMAIPDQLMTSHAACQDLVVGIRCNDLPNPCNDTLGRISCQRYCGLCDGTTKQPTTTTTKSSTILSQQTTITITAPTAATTTTPDVCSLSPCLNGGVCRAAGSGFVCVCGPGYTQPFCLPEMKLTTTTAPPTMKQCTDRDIRNKCQIGLAAAEVVFMIEYAQVDSSNCNMRHQGRFINTLVDRWRVLDRGIRVAVVSYHDTVEQRIQLDDFEHSPAGLQAAVTALTGNCYNDVTPPVLRPRGTANLTRALDFVRDTAFMGSRPGVPRAVIPIIQNVSRQAGEMAAAVMASQRLRGDCVAVLPMVSIHPYNEDKSGLDQLASSPSNDFYDCFYDFEDLEKSADDYGTTCNIKQYRCGE